MSDFEKELSQAMLDLVNETLDDPGFKTDVNKMLSEVAGGEVMMERRRRRMMARNKNIREDKN